MKPALSVGQAIGIGAALVGLAVVMVLVVSRRPAGQPRATASDAACAHPADGSVHIPPGEVWLGEDGPGALGIKVPVAGFWIDRTEVTNRQFAAFVAATGHVTAAEKEGWSAVYVQPDRVDGLNPAQWWRRVDGASWRHPTGPRDSIAGRDDHPVVQVTYEDAAAYARWVGRSLPDVMQWERAARGPQGAPRSPLDWAYAQDAKPIANTWQGVFPEQDAGTDGYTAPAPVGCFPANEFGLYDMIGNVWEWTTSGDSPGTRTIKGGSFLCSMNYCANFRPAGWQAQEADLATSHLGFRTVSTQP